jgi:hypothetical protein
MRKMKQWACLYCLLALPPLARAQDNAAMPRRYFAARFAWEHKGPSFTPGLLFEYLYHRRPLLQLGFNAVFTFGGSADSFGQGVTLANDDAYDYSKLGLGATAYLYPGGKGHGFLLCGELGVMRTFRFGLVANNLMQGWAQSGAGWQWKLRKNTLRCTTGFMYVMPDRSRGFRERLGIQTVVAMGF